MPAKEIVIIADPGRAKARGNPEAKAKAMTKIKRNKKNNSI
jgi:hypothetical protein